MWENSNNKQTSNGKSSTSINIEEIKTKNGENKTENVSLEEKLNNLSARIQQMSENPNNKQTSNGKSSTSIEQLKQQLFNQNLSTDAWEVKSHTLEDAIQFVIDKINERIKNAPENTPKQDVRKASLDISQLTYTYKSWLPQILDALVKKEHIFTYSFENGKYHIQA